MTNTRFSSTRTSGLIGVPADVGNDPLASPPTWWWYPLAIMGAGLVGLILATYRGAPIGDAATDFRHGNGRHEHE